MNEQPQQPKQPPLEVAQRIHELCKNFESAWRGAARPQLVAFLADVSEPERSWLLVELVALEVELRQAEGEQPTEAEYRQIFPREGEWQLIAEAFRRCTSDAEPSAWRAELRKESGEGSDSSTRPLTRLGSPVDIEGYEILDLLGRGGMGVVYKARDLRLKRFVALKMILTGEHAGEEQLARFRTEAEMVARLQHPNIVQIYEVREERGNPCIVFEYIKGPTLADFARGEPQTPRVASELLEGIARAIQYAHEQGIVHRDLKPTNILLASDGWPSNSSYGSTVTSQSASAAGLSSLIPKITDFGLAKDLAADLDQTASGTILGTLLYMSPEQAEGRRNIGPASDIYSLGAILYVLLTGRAPIQGTTKIETLHMVINTEPVAPTQLQPRLPRDLETICLTCLHKDPARRYTTAGALADDLRRFLGDEPILARPSGRIEKAWRWCRRNRLVASLIATVLLVLVSGIVVSGLFAYTAGEEARSARKAEQEAGKRELAETAARKEAGERERAEIIARKEADAQRERAETAIAETLLDQGLLLCENHDVTRGLLTLARALEFAPPGASSLQEAIRLNLAFWRGKVCVPTRIEGSETSTMTAVAFAPDGKTFLSGEGINWIDESHPQLFLHDALTGATIGSPRKDHHRQAIWRIAFAPNGKRFATADNVGTARLWDAATREPIGAPMRHGVQPVLSLAFSPDGKRLLTSSGNPGKRSSTLSVWDGETGDAIGMPVSQPGDVQSVAWSEDGKLWATGGKLWAAGPSGPFATSSGEIRFWDAETRQPHGEPIPQADGVGAVAFQPKSGQLAVGTGDGVVRFWDPATRRRADRLLQQHLGRVTSMTFSRDGQFLLVGSGETRKGRGVGGEARLWNALTGQLAAPPMAHPEQVNDVALSPDLHTAVTAGEDGRLYVWRFGASIAADYVLRPPGLMRTLVTPDAGTLITVGRNVRGEIMVQHWDARTGRKLGYSLYEDFPDVWAFDAKKPFGKYLRLVDRPDGKCAAGVPALLDPKMEIRGPWFFWDSTTYKSIQVPGEVRNSYCLAFSPDSKLLATGRHLPNGDGECRVWATDRWQQLQTIVIKSPVLSLVFSADGHSLLAGASDGVVRRWSVPEGKLLSESDNLGGQVREIRLSPNGTRVLSETRNAHSSMIQLWNPADMTPIGPKWDSGDQKRVSVSHFVPGGRYFFTDDPIQVWDTANGQLRRKLHGPESAALPHAVHPGGAYLALGVSPNLVRLWHLETGNWIGPSLSFPAQVDGLVFSPDGAALYVACNSTLERYPLPAALEGSPPRVKWDLQELTQRRLAEDGSLIERSVLSAEEYAVKALRPVLPTSEKEAQTWHYTTEKPAEDWFKSSIPVGEKQWQQGPGGFGIVPYGTIRTKWKSADIWLRRDFELSEAPTGEVYLRLFNRSDAEIYLNGVLAAQVAGPIPYYATVPISEQARQTLRPGTNTLAIHARKKVTPDQEIDAGLVEWLPETNRGR